MFVRHLRNKALLWKNQYAFVTILQLYAILWNFRSIDEAVTRFLYEYFYCFVGINASPRVARRGDRRWGTVAQPDVTRLFF